MRWIFSWELLEWFINSGVPGGLEDPSEKCTVIYSGNKPEYSFEYKNCYFIGMRSNKITEFGVSDWGKKK